MDLAQYAPSVTLFRLSKTPLKNKFQTKNIIFEAKRKTKFFILSRDYTSEYVFYIFIVRKKIMSKIAKDET
jgi:hypothetical protein